MEGAHGEGPLGSKVGDVHRTQAGGQVISGGRGPCWSGGGSGAYKDAVGTSCGAAAIGRSSCGRICRAGNGIISLCYVVERASRRAGQRRCRRVTALARGGGDSV